MTAAPPAWSAFADAVLQREALICRVGRGIPARDFAGMYVDDADVERILRQLPGLDGPAPAQVGHVRAITAHHLGDARAALHDLAGDASPFADIARVAQLGAHDLETLAVVAAVELDPQRQRLVGYLQDHIALTRVTLDLLGRLFEPEHAGPLTVARDSPLLRSRLVEVVEEGPWAVWMVRPAARLVWAVMGDDTPDAALPAATTRVHAPSRGSGPCTLVMVHGGDPRTRRDIAMRMLPAERFVVSGAPTDASAVDALVREAVVTEAAVLLEVEDEMSPQLRDCITQTHHLAWAILSPTPLRLEVVPQREWVERLAPTELVDGTRWQQVIGHADGHGHRLTPSQLDLVARAAPALGHDSDAAVRRLASGQLDTLAVHVAPRRGWDDMVLPTDCVAALRELTARYRHRYRVYEEWGFRPLPSAGLVAMFAGPSGTGKTLAAEIVAGDLGLDLYKIDLSSVVSKYIGETEKNLERIFSAAACANVVLFFDEADALFGRRSEVGDAHDRYANIEVSYLLQRLETYDGLVVLATNLQRNMDAAFLRRIHVAVEFALPDDSARRAIWALSFPPDAPIDGVDLDFLARQFKLSGGSIRNTALAAAFLAAAEDEAVGMPHVMRALKREFQKLGRLRTEAEFDRYFSLVQAAEA